MSVKIPQHLRLGVAGLDEFGLRVASYAYPTHRTPGAPDSNWLRMQGEVVREDVRWTFDDPCLMTQELGELIAWLKRMPEPESTLTFLEFLLRFDVLSDDPPWTMRITLRGEVVPERVLPGHDRWENGVMLTIETSQAQIERVVSALEADLRRFPPR